MNGLTKVARKLALVVQCFARQDRVFSFTVAKMVLILHYIPIITVRLNYIARVTQLRWHWIAVTCSNFTVFSEDACLRHLTEACPSQPVSYFLGKVSCRVVMRGGTCIHTPHCSFLKREFGKWDEEERLLADESETLYRFCFNQKCNQCHIYTDKITFKKWEV